MTLSDYLSSNGMTRTQFATQIGVDQSLVSRWVSRKCIPNDSYKLKIFEVTGGHVTPNDLLTLASTSQQPEAVP